MSHKLLPRRSFLKGLGTLMALPMLEAMMPSLTRGGLNKVTHPKRLAFVYIPNGVNMEDWSPASVGSDFELPSILEPLGALRSELQVISGLAHDKARPNGDGAGDHARASATFLTGCQAVKTDGADIKVGISVDQVAAHGFGRKTRFSSLELGCDHAKQTGNCDSGYSCAYSFNISWKSESTPMPPEVNPKLLFERLFGNNQSSEMAESRSQREQFSKSILDFVMEDARRLHHRLGANDRRKLDEYMTAVRELELRTQRVGETGLAPVDYARPDGIPQSYEAHIRLMFDLLALAFQTDSTRVATFIMAHDGSNRPYPFIGVSEGHHDISHHGNDEEKKKKIAKINRFHVAQFAHFLEKLKSVKEGDGTLLDNSMIVYGSGISDGNRHSHHDLPVILAGGGGGTLTTGRHIKYAKDTPMTNLYLSLLDRLEIPCDRLGDSTGPLQGLNA